MKSINAYLTFDGNAREAMQFYAKCIGAEVQIMSFGEAKIPCPDSAKDRVMHALLKQNGAILMASDTMPGMPFQMGSNFSVSLACENVQEAEKVFAALSEKGKVSMPLQETFWAIRFGMLVDKYGVQWMVNLDKAH